MILNIIIKNNVGFSKVNKNNIINSICETWYSETIITKNVIISSFKVCGLSNIKDGSEDKLIIFFEFLKNKIDDINDE